ncbi:DUF1330 domain-containing protein [Paraburkholderia nemoris]|jgi:uncharacterized protein (DUF1330 family)|uniref:DUF1330 domain-containing protein n=1 Tax=Paraburkholderia nemoris TaxID=2793076 RepID=A0ABN7M0U2_9BURK|nr:MULTISPECIES: DUF1330 domain-containing protein [Paraburkholderia]MBK3812283.1 DUF1330 domain-containing protein [Paraburkholderia aspalathi]CAE6762704.1 hypothetical protein R75777_03522 [Paraburkholderia nemoris]CAE6779010.1 hypothetical protein R69776_04217 [Paraburkholderia nemoris]
MAKGYWIGHVDVHDLERYKSYITANAEVFSRYGGRFVVRGGERLVKEGNSRARTVVIEFQDYATAVACYESAEYELVKAKRDCCSTADILIIEGYDGPQPGMSSPA